MLPRVILVQLAPTKVARLVLAAPVARMGSTLQTKVDRLAKHATKEHFRILLVVPLVSTARSAQLPVLQVLRLALR